MSIDQAEKLKRELTDKWVIVADGSPELRRFRQLTGKVKTVNMNCRALVEFDGPEDIGWYDIDPQYLTVVDAPRPKAAPEAKHQPAAEAKAAPAAKAAATGGSPLDKIRAGATARPAAPAGGSPLDKIRAQAGGAAAPTAKPAGGSPLDKIRAAGAAKPQAAAPAEKPAEKPAEESPAAPTAKTEQKKPATGSPLDQIRAQGGFKG